MSRISIAFFGAAVFYALCGMVLGVVMGASNDHTLLPVHAHINLLGWASLALMGAFYGLAGSQAPVKLAWANFAISNLGNLVTLPLLTMLLKGDPGVIPVMAIGEVIIIIGMLTFGAAVLTVARRIPATAA
jgi:hypothetical protein